MDELRQALSDRIGWLLEDVPELYEASISLTNTHDFLRTHVVGSEVEQYVMALLGAMDDMTKRQVINASVEIEMMVRTVAS